MNTGTAPQPPRILSIAGSDSSGGAGIQADLKTITMLGGYGMAAITAVTAQNTMGVDTVEALSPELVEAQVAACLSDIGVDAVKIGMLGSPDVAQAVERALDGCEAPVVFDPVMVATSGAVLADDATIAAFEPLMRRAEVITPNLPELEALSGMPCDSVEALTEAALSLAGKFGCAVLAKGGHADGDRVIDRLVFMSGDTQFWDDAKIETRHTHGTGCTLSSAIATLRGHGQDIRHSTKLARQFVRRAIEGAPGYGSGNGPLGHNGFRK